MTREQIITQLYNSPDLNNVIKGIDPEHLRDELKQEVILVICELPEDKLLKLHEAGHLRFYVWRVITNMAYSSTSKFYRVFRKPHPTIHDNMTEELTEQDNQHIEIINRMCESPETAEWFNGRILKLYAELGTMDKVAKEIGIPKNAIFRAVHTARKMVKSRIR